MITDVDMNHGHLFCGLGGGARGINRARPRTGTLRGRWVCKGGIDVNPAACRDFERLTGTPATCMDLFTREQYRAYHGAEPPKDFREVMPADIRAVYGPRLHWLFLSAPCQGFSGLLAESKSRTGKYMALNALTLRGVWLVLEAYKDEPIEFIAFENVPRIATRGRHFLDQIVGLLEAYGYAVRETKHDCGELGGLAQSRKRFLLMARHTERVPPFLYEPPKRPLKGVGEVIGRFPMPGPDPVLPMHRVPSLQWKTWVRLAFVEAGSDWRSLNRLNVEDGMLADYGIAPETDWHGDVLGVRRWEDPSGTVTSRGRPTNGAFALADPRVDGHAKSVALGVRPWDRPAGVVNTKMIAGGGPHSVADPRVGGEPYNHVYRIVDWAGPSPSVTSANGGTAAAVADPRGDADRHVNGKYRVTAFDEGAGTVLASSTTGNGAFAVADPRHDWHPGASSSKERVTPWDGPARPITGAQQVASGAGAVADPRPAGLVANRENYETGGHYGVVCWDGASGAVPAYAKHDRGRWSVADPRGPIPASGGGAGEPWSLPEPRDQLVCLIRALDGTWHRPFTTLELAALQSLVDAEEVLELDGLSDSAWRERIGNAVPSEAAEAMGEVVGRALLGAWTGESFALSSTPVWVRDVAVAIAVDGA